MPSVFGSYSTQDMNSQGHDYVPKFNEHFVEQNGIFQSAQTEVLVRENQRLAASHGSLRQELVAIRKEIQKIQNHKFDIENDYQLSLQAHNSRMEADIQAGETLKKMLQDAKMEEKDLVISMEELSAEIWKLTSDLQKAYNNLKLFPQMYAELESLQQENQVLEASYKYNNGLKVQQLEHNLGIDRNLMAMASEAEKLREEIAKLEEKDKLKTKALDSHGGHNELLPGYMGRYGRLQIPQIGSASTGGKVWRGGLPQQPKR